MAATDPTITEVVRTRDNAGIRSRRILQITGPVSYSTGGFPLASGKLFLGVKEIVPSVIGVDALGANPRLFTYDYTNEKMLAFVPSTAAEVAAAVDLSGYVFRIEVAGK
jgi:hypothetical protein